VTVASLFLIGATIIAKKYKRGKNMFNGKKETGVINRNTEPEKPAATMEINTLLGQGMRMDATTLVGKGIVQIEGEFNGEVDIDGSLVLTNSGHINGNTRVKVAYISGNITGNIFCSELLHVMATGKIKGDIECDAILMDEGAIFNGNCKMNEQRESNPLVFDEEE